MKPEIVITSTPDGDITIEVVNGQGETCKTLTKDIEKALGLIKNQENKPEFFQEQMMYEKGIVKVRE